MSDELRVEVGSSMSDEEAVRVSRVVAQVWESGLVRLMGEAYREAEPGMVCGILGDWYEERGRELEAALARGGRPLESFHVYMEHRLGREIGGGTIRVTAVLQ